MSITAVHGDPAAIAAGERVLADLRDVCPSLVYAMLVTDDGFEIVRVPAASDGGRFASMASSMQALGDAVARELAIGSSDYLVIASPTGHVIQRRVPGHPIVLSALFDDDETLGKGLSVSRAAAEKLSALLGGGEGR